MFEAAPGQTCCAQDCSWSSLLCFWWLLLVKPAVFGLPLVKPAAFTANPGQTCYAKANSRSNFLCASLLLIKTAVLKAALVLELALNKASYARANSLSNLLCSNLLLVKIAALKAALALKNALNQNSPLQSWCSLLLSSAVLVYVQLASGFQSFG